MPAGPPDEAQVLGRTLDDGVRALEALVHEQAERGRALIAALTEQLAAGQGESLYGLQSASAALGRRTGELYQVASALPEQLAAQLPPVLEAQLSASAAELVEAVQRAVEVLVTDASAVTRAMEKVADSVLTRLIATLDERDRRDQLLEDRLNARVDRLTTRTAEKLDRVSQELDAQVARLEARDATARHTTSQELLTLVERLLAEPRGSLRALRTAARETAPPPPPAPTTPRTRRKKAKPEDEGA